MTINQHTLVHAIACIHHIHRPMHKYVSPFFYTETWRKTFQVHMHPIPSMDMWPTFDDTDILEPSEKRRQLGQPKKHRRRNMGEACPARPAHERR